MTSQNNATEIKEYGFSYCLEHDITYLSVQSCPKCK